MLPKPVTLAIMPKPFGGGYLYIAAFKGNEETGPFGHGSNPTEAVNNLVDVTEEMIADDAGEVLAAA